MSSPLEKEFDEAQAEDLKKALATILQHPNLLEAILKKKAREITRREGWSKLSNASYYRERFGKEFGIVLDSIMQDGKDKEYRYFDYPDMSRKTLYLRVMQSKMYLFDHLDPEDKYKNFFHDRVTISREKSGVRLTLHKEKDEKPFVAGDISLDEKRSDWLDKIDKFLEEAKPKDVLHMKDLSLTEEEIETQKNSFNGLDQFVAFITHKEIKIVRIE